MKTNMPQEPQSETPLIASKAAWRIAEHYKDGIKYEVGKENFQHAHQFISDQVKLACQEYYADKEHELNEVNNGKRKLSNDLIDCVRERDKLQQELDQVRGELERAKESLVAERLSASELAKQNHKMREALYRIAKTNLSGNSYNLLSSWEQCAAIAAEAINPNLSSLTVLSRAEVEVMKCECDLIYEAECQNDPDIVGIRERNNKCIKHILLERFTK